MEAMATARSPNTDVQSPSASSETTDFGGPGSLADRPAKIKRCKSETSLPAEQRAAQAVPASPSQEEMTTRDMVPVIHSRDKLYSYPVVVALLALFVGMMLGKYWLH